MVEAPCPVDMYLLPYLVRFSSSPPPHDEAKYRTADSQRLLFNNIFSPKSPYIAPTLSRFLVMARSRDLVSLEM